MGLEACRSNAPYGNVMLMDCFAEELPRVKVTDGLRFCSCWWMVSLTRYMSVDGSQESPNAASNCRQA